MPRDALDPQRSRVYSAEDRVFHGEMLELGIDELQEMSDEIALSPWFRRRYDPKRIVVKDGRGGKTARSGCDGKSVHLRHGTRMKYILLHEIAHAIDSTGTEDHGSVFAGLYLYLVGRVYGDWRKKVLCREFNREGVVWDAKIARNGKP